MVSLNAIKKVVFSCNRWKYNCYHQNAKLFFDGNFLRCYFCINFSNFHFKSAPYIRWILMLILCIYYKRITLYRIHCEFAANFCLDGASLKMQKYLVGNTYYKKIIIKWFFYTIDWIWELIWESGKLGNSYRNRSQTVTFYTVLSLYVDR